METKELSNKFGYTWAKKSSVLWNRHEASYNWTKLAAQPIVGQVTKPEHLQGELLPLLPSK